MARLGGLLGMLVLGAGCAGSVARPAPPEDADIFELFTTKAAAPAGTGAVAADGAAGTLVRPGSTARTHREPICSGTREAPPEVASSACCYGIQYVVQKAVRAHFDEFRACYDAAIARDPGVRGRVAASFSLEPDGHVARACEARDEGAPDGLDDPALVACVLDVFTKVQLPGDVDAICGTVRVTYPLTFEPT